MFSQKSRQRLPFRSCLRQPGIRLPRGWSPAWHNRVAMPRVLQHWRTILPARGSNSCASSYQNCTIWHNGDGQPIHSIGNARGGDGGSEKLGLDVQILAIRQPSDITRTFETLGGRADALYVCTDALAATNRIRIN